MVQLLDPWSPQRHERYGSTTSHAPLIAHSDDVFATHIAGQAHSLPVKGLPDGQV